MARGWFYAYVVSVFFSLANGWLWVWMCKKAIDWILWGAFWWFGFGLEGLFTAGHENFMNVYDHFGRMKR